VLSAGDSFVVATPDGPRTATIRRFQSAQWKPGTFDALLVSVDLQIDGTSAVLLVDPAPPADVRLEALFEGGRWRLRWPEGAAGTVEVAESVTAGSWSLLGLPVTARDGYLEVELAEGPARFFRWRRHP
jgi:hypothetical protein